MDRERLIFPEGFTFGCAAASYQIEGSGSMRGRSIWDDFCKVPGAIADGSDGSVACDHLNRFEEDIELLAELGVDSYRLSFSWPRLLPEDEQHPDPEGIAFYTKLLEALNAKGIKPMVTLYHWDLPSRLQEAGGWPQRATTDAYETYARFCFDTFDHLVNTWITLNEPYCSAFLGYYYGDQAPGIRDLRQAHRAVCHLNLAHAKALEVYRTGGYTKRIGTALNLFTPRPKDLSKENLEAAERAADHGARLYLDPILGLGYPEEYLSKFPSDHFPILEEDLELLSRHEPDFVGINYYSESVVKADPTSPFGFDFCGTDLPKTHMGWDIIPEGLSRQLRYVHERTGDIPLVITENGSAWEDSIEDGKVEDTRRIDYLKRHLEVCREVVEEGIPLTGYYAWSNMDNFEWAYGYSRRFGLIYVDYQTQKRIPKESYHSYKRIIARNKER